MSRFASKETIKIQLGDDWVEVKKSLSYAVLEPIISSLDRENEMANTKMAIPLLRLAIADWNFTDDNGEKIKYNPNLVSELDMTTILELVPHITDLYFPQKKNLEQ